MTPALRALADDRRAQRHGGVEDRRGRRAAPRASPAGACGRPGASPTRRAPAAARHPAPGRRRARPRRRRATTRRRRRWARPRRGAPPAAELTRAAAMRRHGVERDATPRPAREVADRTEHRRRPVDDAVERRGDGQPDVERDGHELGGERADHAEVGVRDVEAAGVEPAAHLTAGERVDRDAAGQRDREPVHRDAVVTAGRRTVPLAVRAGRRREHLDVVTGRARGGGTGRAPGSRCPRAAADSSR